MSLNLMALRLMPEDLSGVLLALFVGVLAGWVAEKMLRRSLGIYISIALGLIGSVVANVVLAIAGIGMGGLFGYVTAGLLGASLFIFIGRKLRKRRTKTSPVKHPPRLKKRSTYKHDF